MKRIFFLLSLLTLTLQFRAQGVWCEGTSWETHYDNGTVETFTLSGTAVINEITYMKLVSDVSGLVGYIRAEQGDKLVYARGIVNKLVLAEYLLYDFRKSFEYGDVFRYGVLQDGVPTVVEVPMERETAKIVWYEDVLGEGTSLPAWDNILYKVGWLGNPMELFYQKEEASSARKAPGRPKPNTTNVSHIVFRPGGGKPCYLATMKYTQTSLKEQMTDFGFRLFKQMIQNKESDEPNLVMSPVSAQMALSMLMNGAEGRTLEQIRQVMGAEKYSADEVNSYNHQLSESLWALSQDSTLVETTNGIWAQLEFPFEEKYFQNMQHYYDAEVFNVNFRQPEAIRQINLWVDKHTHGLIERVLNPNDPSNKNIKLVLANALYFMGRWMFPFAKEYIRQDTFHNMDGSESEVNMLYGEPWRYYETERYKAVEVTYGKHEYVQNPFSLLLVLPKSESGNTPLSYSDYIELVNNSRLEKAALYMPCFNVRSEYDLKETLKKMGILDAFTTQANFAAMSPVALYVEKAKQLMSFHLDENGTEAAAVTVKITDPSSEFIPPPTQEIYLNRPFQFVLQDCENHIPLFIGQVNMLKNQEPRGIEKVQDVQGFNGSRVQELYDLQGRRLTGKPTHGIYIEDGKKRVIK